MFPFHLSSLVIIALLLFYLNFSASLICTVLLQIFQSQLINIHSKGAL